MAFAQKMNAANIEGENMRNAKKLMLLVLSLVLLVGIFAFAALAEEPATEATVVYPDGSTETVAVGETITPKEFTEEGGAKLFYGAGNTLFKATGENWTFTVDGAALTDLTVTDAMVGKTIVAGGVDKVYASVEINITEGNYAIYQGGAYVLAGSTVEDVTIRKIPVGTHNLYFTNASDVQKFLNTTCSYEIDGVTYTHHDIRSLRANSAKVTLYENNKVSSISWSGSDADRPASAAGASSGGMNYPASVLLDLNGHTLVNTTTGYNDLRSMVLYIYSSAPGAFYDASAAANSMFRTNNDAAIYLGDDNDTETDYSDNINFLCKVVNEYLYGTGISIIGGNFYQTAPSANGMVNISRRFGIENAPGAIVNAKFYLFPGSNAVLNNATAAGATISVSNCEFYTSSAAALVYTAKRDSNAVTVNADGCSFYGVTQDYIRAADDTTTTATLNITNTVVATKDAVVYNTVNWADGTSSYYYATSEAEAKAFVEMHPKAAQPAPYGKWVDGEYFVAFNPSLFYTYDDAFNAEQTLVDGELTKVYYTLTIGDEVTYVTDGSTLNNYLRSMDYGVKITLYANHEVSTNYVGGRKSMEKNSAGSYIAMVTSYQLDLNGYTLTLTSSSKIESHAYQFYIYSSRPNGRIEAPNAATPFYTNNGDYKIIDGKEYGNTAKEYTDSAMGPNKPTGSFYFGEASNPGSANAGPYGKNLTVVCKSLVGGLYGNTIHIFGGTFIQLKGSSESIFLNYTNRGVYHYHATFITTNPNTVPVNPNGSNKTYYNCTFAYDGVGSVALTNSTTAGSFNNCNFVNVAPSYSVAHVYNNCAYGTTSYYPVADLDASDAAAVYLAHGTTSKEITVNGKTLVLDGVLINDAATALKLTHEGFGTDYWVVGSTVNVPLDEITKVEGDQLLSGAYYDYSAIAEIVDGVVNAAGEATAVISFAKSEELAFSYLDTKTGILDGVTYAECGGTAAGVGEKFHELFASPASAYEITMFKDMEISKAMGFGPLVPLTDGGFNADYYNSLASGSIVWDLNGTTVTISKDLTGIINVSSSNFDLTKPDVPNQDRPTVFGFEGNSVSDAFTLKSSKAGGKIVNESSAAIFGVGEGKKTKVIFDGENLTLESPNAPIFRALEMSYDIAGWAEANKLRLIVNGGTYISGGDYVFNISTYAQLANATFISTNPYAVSVVSHDTYRAGAATVTNCTFIAANPAAIAYKAGSTKGASLSFSGGTFANCLIPTTENCANLTVAYAEGTYYTSTFEDLAKLYASAPAGTVLAAKSVAYNGVSYKLCGYYAETESFVTVQIPLADIIEKWVVGGEYIYSTSIENVNVVYQDGKYYYRANPVWTARLGGEVVDDILSPDNADKIVVLDVEGELETVYAIRDIAGTKTYFYGDVEKVNAELCAMFTAMKTSSTVTFYEDFTLTITGGCQIVNAGGGTQNIDLNGHTLKVVSTLVETEKEKKQYAFKFQKGNSYVYSSVPGGVIDASEMPSLVMTDGSGNAYFGESSTSGTAYGANLTVYCRWFSGGRLWSNNAHIYGGTYVQTEAADYFFTHDDGPVPTVKNATFILDGTAVAAIRRVVGTYENCVFISKSPVNLLAAYTSNNTGATFNGCYFYNIIPNVIEGVTVTYTDCHFDKASDIAQAGGYIAYTGETATLTVKGETYAFAAKLYAAGEVGLIDWGFGMKEYWAIGVEASHADVLLDQFFTYSYAPFTVEGDCEAEKTLALAAGTVQMSLTLQSQIGVNLYFSEALSGATIKYAGAEIPLATLVAADGFYKLSDAIAPNVADQVATVTIVIGENEHVLTVGIGAYAKAVLASEDYADVHKLTYAMVEYVRSMVESDFLAGVGAPDGYEAQTVDIEKKYNKGENVLLNAISFNLSGTIEIAIEAGEAEDGAVVTLTLASGRTVTATIEGGVASFEGLYINEFYGDLTISVGDETYSYCIENYHNAMDEAHKPAIAALYTYAYYAVEYVATLQ